MTNNQPWRWFLKLENWVQSIREVWVKMFGQSPNLITYIGYGSESQVRILARAVYTGKKERQDPQIGVRGWKSFLAVPYRLAEVTITVNKQQYSARTDEGGILDHSLQVALKPGWHSVQLGLENGVQQEARILVISKEQRFGVISDIDDTVMITSLSQPLLALWNTFLLAENARDAVSGMPVLYERIHQKNLDAPFLYLSTGAWNAFPNLQRFMARNMFPLGPMLLTDWGTSSERWFRSGQEHKRQNLTRLVEEFPNIRWLLIGDDGEHDPQRYQELASRYPENVLAIAIRKLNNDRVQWSRVENTESSADTGTAEPQITWIFGHDGSGIGAQLKNLGLI
ncbi:MAG: phosphatase domain-containing protein [Microbacteriaceae bacterium]